jgi:subtilisin family serine protease
MAGAAEPAPSASKAAPPAAGNGHVAPIIHVKFREGSAIRLRGGQLVSLEGTDTSGLDRLVAEVPKLRIDPLFVGTEEGLAQKREAAERRSGNRLTDFNLWYRLVVPAGADPGLVLERLRDLPVVEHARAEPLVARTATTPDFTPLQGYRLAAPDGINAPAARTLPGGTGDRVKIIDIEFSWDTTHEDLAKAANGLIPNGTPWDPNDDTRHGTAVLGELIASDNGIGVTGIAPGAGIGMINIYNEERFLDLHNSIRMAADRLAPGDVMLIEVGIYANRWENDMVPVEYDPLYHEVIRYATSRGIIVVEAAGNGGNDLDALNIGAADSGAIMVGAGEAPNWLSGAARSRAPFSNFGSRVDVQAWGEGVATTGYGDLHSGADNQRYTQVFGGTSSASGIVAGAAAILSSVTEARTGVAAPPSYIRNLLRTTGTPQFVEPGMALEKIGPQPDVARAVEAIMAPDTAGPVVSGPYQAGAKDRSLLATGEVPATINWSGVDRSGVTAYAVKMSKNGGAWTSVQLPTPTSRSTVVNLVPGARYQFQVAAKDGAGNWSVPKRGVTFVASRIAETSSSIRYSGGWTRVAYGPAVGGYVKTAVTEGASARLSFTGRNISWIGTKAATRGKADVYVDGVYQGRIDLYSATTYPRRILFSRNVTAGTTHSLEIVLVGTATRPKVDIDAFVVLK